MLEEMIEEMKCLNCIHAPVCAIQKGGVNLQLVDSMGCEYYQPETPKDSVLVSKEKLLEIAKDYTEMAKFHTEIHQEKTHIYKQAVKEACGEIVKYGYVDINGDFVVPIAMVEMVERKYRE